MIFNKVKNAYKKFVNSRPHPNQLYSNGENKKQLKTETYIIHPYHLQMWLDVRLCLTKIYVDELQFKIPFPLILRI